MTLSLPLRLVRQIAAATGAALALTLFAAAPAQAATTAPAGTYQENSTALSYTGSWKKLASAGSSGGAIRYSSSTNAAVSLTFTGTNITWYTWKSPSAGIIDVYIDGVRKTRVDNYAAKSSTKVRAFTALDLKAGTHKITLKYSGSSNARSSGGMFHFDSLVVGKTAQTAAAAASSAGSVGYAGCPAGTLNVSTSDQLTRALAAARAGTVIRLAAGTYTSVSGDFRLATSGTSAKPIWICGPQSAVIRGTSLKTGAALRLDGASNVRVSGFTVTNALQGVMVKAAKNVVVSDMVVKDIGYEGIHLYANTTDSYVLDNVIARTGSADVAYGEGVYIGTSQRRWGEVMGGSPDRSDRNTISGNVIKQAGAEAIEAKEGTSNGVIRDNTIEGQASGSRAQGWVLVTGNKWSIVGNTGSGAVTHGYASMVWNSWGKSNDFRKNRGAVNASGFGVWVQDPNAGVTVACDSWTTAASSGVTNVFCTP